MARPNFKLASAGILLLGAVSCTVAKQATPSLTGPSDVGTSISIQVIPDTIAQDGASQSLVTITARDGNGQPIRNLPLRAEISVGGVTTDFGSLSARNLVTDANGRASVTYTAPPPPPIQNGNGTVVSISVTATGTDFGNSVPRVATIRLTPPGVIGAPPSFLRADFVLPAATVGDAAVFTANVTDSANNDASGQVASYSWNFGDGFTATGRTVSHTYTDSGNFPVTVSIIDSLGRVGTTSRSLSVSAGANPSATFVVSPSSPNVGQTVGFNASAAAATPGHSITSYAWDFGDGSVGSGVTTTHAYSAAGSYTVVLTTRDDVGRRGTSTVGVSVGVSGPSASFTFSPSSPLRGQAVSFDASSSRAAVGRTIRSYAWNYDDGSTDSGVQTSHTFNTAGTFNVRLITTDDLGQTSTSAQQVTVGGATPSASFTFSPTSPQAGQAVSFDASGSRAATGRTITQYAWNFDDGGVAFGVTTQHAFTNAGNYSVRLTITDDIGQTATSTQAVTVGGANPTASFAFTPSAPVTGQSVQFDASSSRAAPGRTITAYSWNFDDGTTGPGITTSHSFTAPRTYAVRLTVTDDFGRTNTTTQNVVVGAGGPTAAFTFTPSTPATGQSVTFDASSSRPATGRTITAYQWNFDDGGTGTGVTTSHTFTAARTYAVRLTITDDQGQTNTTSQNVVVSGATPTASYTFAPSAPATGQSVAFDASSSRPGTGRTITAYQWNFDDGSTGTGVTTAHTFTVARTYAVRLTVTDDLGQTNTTTQNVVVGSGNPTPAFTFAPSAPSTNQSVAFDASSSRAASGRTITSYAWNFDDGTTGSGVTTNHAFTAARTYAVRLTVTDDVGQTASVTNNVPVSTAPPVSAFTFTPQSPVTNQVVSFDASTSRGGGPGRTITGYAWDFGDSATSTGVQTTHSYLNPGNYIVRLTVTDDLGQTTTSQQTVTVSSGVTAVFEYSPATPNVNQPVFFDARQSFAPAGRTIVSYSWTWGDGTPTTTSASPTTSHTFTSVNTFVVRLTVTDDTGRTGTATQNVTTR